MYVGDQSGANWIVRHNLFRNIVAPAGELAGPAVLVWNASNGTLTEGNRFLNCARGIAWLPWKQYLSGFRFAIEARKARVSKNKMWGELRVLMITINNFYIKTNSYVTIWRRERE